MSIVVYISFLVRNEKKQIKEIKNLPEYEQYKELVLKAKYLKDHNVQEN